MLNLYGAEKDDENFLALAVEVTGYYEPTLLKGDAWRIAQYTNSEGEVRFFAQSFDFTKIMGYSGYTNLAIILNSSGKVESVEILSSQDTRSFIRRLTRTGFLDQYGGYNGTQELTLVTGATVSSEAINETVTEVSAQIRKIIEDILPDNE